MREKVRDLRRNPGGLLADLDAATRAALASGALQPIETTQTVLEEEGVRFLVRVVSNLARKDAAGEERKRRARGARPANPFLPFEPAMYVTEITPTHVALLNKFNVIDRHLLIVTRDFEHQEMLLNAGDFEALHRCMAEYEGLGFYNGGVEAGASQPHKHLQFVPLPLGPEGPLGSKGPLVPIAPLLATGQLPFSHAFATLDPARELRDPAVAEITCELYRQLLAQLGLAPPRSTPDPRQSAPYNLLLTRHWMLVVPRCREHFHGVSINALGFAGSLFVRHENDLRPFEEHGPIEALRAVSEP
jgi:sulfate adenylyltransferase (ADP) / ATP adenylyltransferase